MSLGDVSNQSNEQAGFVPTWLQQSKAAHPDSDVVRAIVAATAGERLDESRLIRDLRALITPPAKESDA
jgi:hypothetical protein